MSYRTAVWTRQSRWRAEHLPEVVERGTWRGREYDHILPPDDWILGVWPEVRDGLRHYLKLNPISPHRDKHHLNSSWILTANLYFPFAVLAGGRGLMAAFLADVLGSAVAEVETIDLEFAEPPPFDQATLLGEAGGSRGLGMTSPDVGIRFRDGDGSRGVLLVEVKYTEDNLETCSEYRRISSDEQRICHDMAGLIEAPSRCPFVLRNRRYLPVLRSALDAGQNLKSFTRCPAAAGAYQLLRQQALAEAFVESGRFDGAVSALAYPTDNTELLQSVSRAMPDGSSLSDWQTLFGGGSGFVDFTHERFVDFVASREGPDWVGDWVTYVRDRYFAG